MASEIKLTLQHEDFPDLAGPNTVETIVKVLDGFPDDLDGLIESIRDNFREGMRNAAGSHLVDYDSFRSDSDYLDTLDEVIEEMTVLNVAVPGAKAEAEFNAVLAEFRADQAAAGVKGATKPGPDAFEKLLDELQEYEPDVASYPTP